MSELLRNAARLRNELTTSTAFMLDRTLEVVEVMEVAEEGIEGSTGDTTTSIPPSRSNASDLI